MTEVSTVPGRQIVQGSGRRPIEWKGHTALYQPKTARRRSMPITVLYNHRRGDCPAAGD
jgi:hypothetical protein